MRPYVNGELRAALREAIDSRRRELEEVPPGCPIGKGSVTGYKAGCRCPECRGASNAMRLRYRNEHREQENERDRARRRRRREELKRLRAATA